MNRNSRTLPLVLIVFAIAIVFWVGGRFAFQSGTSDHSIQGNQGETTPAASPSITISPTSSAPSPTFSSATQVTTSTPSSAGSLKPPSMRDVREQVEQDPHHTPPALIQFAKEITAQAQAAKQSPESAKAFFGQLEDCVRSGRGEGDSVPVPAQTLCLTTAEEFAKLYPNELGQRLPALEQGASPEVKRIHEALNRF